MIEGMSIFELREHEGDTMNDLVAGEHHYARAGSDRCSISRYDSFMNLVEQRN